MLDAAIDLADPLKSNNGCMAFPRKKKTNKEVLVIRYGAIGDAIWLTPVFRHLKKDGYWIVLNITPYSAQVLRENPNIDEFMIQEEDAVPNADLGEYWKVIGESFDNVINFSGSIEGVLLKLEGTAEAEWPVKKIRQECGNIDYIDRTMEVAGYGDVKGALPELFFSQQEEDMANIFRQSHKDKFLVLCSLSGSSLHKTYPWLNYVAGEIHAKHEDVVIVTVGDELCQFLENWQHKNTINRSGVWPIRTSMIMTKYADLVIGPETGILNAASCYDTPKIMFLSHSSRNNIGRYWKNCVTLHADKKNCECYPCHKLIKSDSCPRGKHKLAARCMENLNPHTVYAAFLKIYKEWKKKNGKSNHAKTG